MFVCTKCKREVTTEGIFCPFCGAAAPQAGSEPGDPYVGQTVAEKYFIHQLLGRGGMGQVYKATHLTLDRPVVLKLLNRSLLSDPSIVQRFHREARAASRLNHPNSINVIDFGQTEDGTLFMAMEFLPGRSLAKVIAEDFPIAPARIVKIASQVLAALTEAHAQGILHRDLKPENVMVESRRDEADFVKVLDFGIAKLNEPGGGGEGPRLTQAGMVCGTPGYMSPEQARGEDLDARADLYAVGVILYEMVTGQMPFDADTPMALVTKVLVEEPIPPSVRRPDLFIPPDLESLVVRALSIDRNARPGSAEEMRGELLACAIPEAPASRPTPAPSHATVVLGAVAEAPKKQPSSVSRAPPQQPPTGAAGAPRPRPSGSVKSPTLRPSGSMPGAAARPSGSVPGAATRPSGSVKSPTAPGRRPTGAPAAGPPRGGPPMALDAGPPCPGPQIPPAPARPGTPPPAPSWPAEEESVAEEETVAEEAEAPAPPPRPRRPPTSPAARREKPGERVGPKKSKMPLIAGAAAGGIVLVALIVYGVTRDGGKQPAAPPAPVAVAPAPPPPLPTPSPTPTVEKPPTPVETPPAPAPTPPVAVERPVAAPEEPVRPVPRRPRPERVAETQRSAPAKPSGDPIRIVKGELNSLPVPPASSGEGILAIVATPWAEVSVNGRVLGETPRELRVVAGIYQIRATHPTLGTRQDSVRVVAGKRNLYDAKLVGR